MQILGKRCARQCAKAMSGLALVAAVAGCAGGGDHSDLKAWMAEVEARPPGRIEPLPPFEQVPPFAYQASAMRSPFEPPVKVRTPDGPRGPQVKPDPNRPRQYLEQYTIASLSMVGTLAQGNRMYALVQDADGGVHRVQRGDYMGTDHGQIQQIAETEIELIEIVPDGTGGWVQRERTVSLGGGERG
jgi:type IV pilus assembly protein PilP